MKKHIQIKNGFNIWNPSKMKYIIYFRCSPNKVKNYTPYLIEWWLHNIGYYLTKPFKNNPTLNNINIRCRDVDLMVESEITK